MNLTWSSEVFYKSVALGAKVGERLLIPPLRSNPDYQETNARSDGKKSELVIRTQLKSGVGERH